MIRYLTPIRRIGWSLFLLMLFAHSGFSRGSSSANQAQWDAVRRSFELIPQSDAYSDNRSSASQNVLSAGLKRVVDNTQITIAVDKAIFHTDYSELSVCAKAVIPPTKGSERSLFLGVRGIKLSYGDSIIGDANLSLLRDVETPFNDGRILPSQFSDIEGRPTRFSSQSLLIDENGISGLFKAKNILSFGQRSASGRKLSVHTFPLELEANKLLGTTFNGGVGVPLKDEESRLTYEALCFI